MTYPPHHGDDDDDQEDVDECPRCEGQDWLENGDDVKILPKDVEKACRNCGYLDE